MAFSLPNPTTPTNGQPGDATPILANEVALAQAIAAFDGSQINSKSVVEAALADTVNPRLRGLETIANFVYTGCIWSLVSGFSGTMTGGTVYVNGYRTTVVGIGANTFAASSDTYVDIDYLGNVTYSAVANAAAAPAITANAVRVAKVVTNGSTITSVLQTGIDSLKNFIYPQNFVKSAADANGWVAFHYPNRITYEQTITITGMSVGANNRTSAGSLNIPVGIIDSSSLRVYATLFAGFGGSLSISLDNGSTNSAVTNFTTYVGNLTTSLISGINGFVYIQAITT